MKKIRVTLSIIAAALLIIILIASQYRTTTHEFTQSQLGTALPAEQLTKTLSQGRKIKLNTIVSADWQLPLGGLLNLDHPTSKKAGLTNQLQPVQIFSFHIQHPEFGDYLIDTGVSNSFAANPREHGIGPLLEPMLGLEALSVLTTTQQYLAQENISQLNGIFLTHLHLDHISGLPDISSKTPIYMGKNESSSKYWMNIATQGAVNTLLSDFEALQEWTANVVDVFNDGSLFALYFPGHTAGSTAYLVNDIKGPILIAGDVSHTRWGWENNVGPGQFSMDKQLNQMNLMVLKKQVAGIKNLRVHLGHQE
jgi:N-acyl homoserine lactone hydrolase